LRKLGVVLAGFMTARVKKEQKSKKRKQSKRKSGGGRDRLAVCTRFRVFLTQRQKGEEKRETVSSLVRAPEGKITSTKGGKNGGKKIRHPISESRDGVGRPRKICRPQCWNEKEGEGYVTEDGEGQQGGRAWGGNGGEDVGTLIEVVR